MSDSVIAPTEYNELLDSIKRTIAAGQLRAARAVNNVLVETYWEIGRDIIERRHEQGWGARVIERLSADLRTANPDVRGLSVRNLQYMTSLASRWPTGIVQQPAAQLLWGHVMVILDACSDRETSDFYAMRAAQEGWTRGALQSMIASRLHERTQPALTNFDQAVPEADRDAVREIVKDPYILDFLAADPVRERDLSKALTDNLARFLRELGTGFAFLGAEVPLKSGDRRHVLYSSQTTAQSTPLFGGRTVVPGTYSGHPAAPGASGRQVPGLGTAAGAGAWAGADEASIGAGVGGA